MRLDDLPDEEAVLLHHSVVEQTAFEARVAFVDQRRLHPSGFAGSQSRCGELVAIFRVAVADRDDLIQQFNRWNVDHAFSTFTDGLKAAIALPDVAAEKRGRELQHCVPAHRHDVRAALVTGGYEDDGAGFEMLPDPGQWKVFLFETHRISH